jgi:hypothetical protein
LQWKTNGFPTFFHAFPCPSLPAFVPDERFNPLLASDCEAGDSQSLLVLKKHADEQYITCRNVYFLLGSLSPACLTDCPISPLTCEKSIPT